MFQIEIVFFERVRYKARSGKTRRKSVPTLDAALGFLADPYIDDDDEDDDDADDDNLSSETQK